MNRGSCRGSFAIDAVTSGRLPMSGLIRSYARRAGLSLFKQFKPVTVNVFPGKVVSLETGSHQLTRTAIRSYLGSAYAVTLTA